MSIQAKFGSVFLVIFGVSLTSSMALAEGWRHAAAPMGQFEGGTSNAAAAIDYSCAGSYSTVMVSLTGDHAGQAILSVDGRDIATVQLIPDDGAAHSTGEISYCHDPVSASGKTRVNTLIRALAQGESVEIAAQDGHLASLSLTGSRRIADCVTP